MTIEIVEAYDQYYTLQVESDGGVSAGYKFGSYDEAKMNAIIMSLGGGGEIQDYVPLAKRKVDQS